MKPAGQVCVEFWQLHAHSNASQQFVFFTVSRRCAGHSGGDCWVHSSFLQADGEERFSGRSAEDWSVHFMFFADGGSTVTKNA